MLPTPSTSHIDPLTIYSPDSDSYLLLDTLAADTSFLHNAFPVDACAPLILELGSGSGILTAFITANAIPLFNRRDITTLSTDVNALASAATVKTVTLETSQPARTPGLFLGALVSDLFAPLRKNVVDVLVFNPPYVPTPDLPALHRADGGSDYDEESRLLALTYAGGADGMEVTQRVIDGLAEVLSARGVAYLLLCGSNKPKEVVKELMQSGWIAEVVGTSGRRGGIEMLEIVRIWRSAADTAL